MSIRIILPFIRYGKSFAMQSKYDLSNGLNPATSLSLWYLFFNLQSVLLYVVPKRILLHAAEWIEWHLGQLRARIYLQQ